MPLHLDKNHNHALNVKRMSRNLLSAVRQSVSQRSHSEEDFFKFKGVKAISKNTDDSTLTHRASWLTLTPGYPAQVQLVPQLAQQRA